MLYTVCCSYVARSYSLSGAYLNGSLKGDKKTKRTWWVAVRIAVAEQGRDSIIAESVLWCLLLGLWELWLRFLLWCMCKHLVVRTHSEHILLVSPQEVI